MRTKFFMLLAAVLLSASAFAQSEGTGTLKGDVNEDGVVDVADINAVIQIMKKGGGIAKETAYYWYVGATAPTALPTDDSNLATGTNPGWRKISDSKPSVGTVIFDGTTSISISSSKVTQYFATNSDINIGSYDAFGNDQTSIALNDPTISNGMKIYTTTSRSKTFDQIIKVKEQTVSYYWYVGTEPITSSSTPGGDIVYGMDESTELGWHTLEGNPTQIQVGPKRLDSKSYWYVAVPSYLGFTQAWGGAMVDELMVPQNITLADGIEYTVFTAMAKSKTIDYIIK